MSTLKEVCKKMAIEEDAKFMKQFESIPVKIKVGGKEDLDPRNWDKPSKAVVASDGCGNGCIIFRCGPHLDEEINAVGSRLSDLGLDDCPEGIWVWEGIYRGITHPSTPNGPEEYDTEVDGKFLIPTAAEWSCIRTNVCPWDEKEWFKDYVSDTDFLRMSIEEEKKKDREFVFDLVKQEDKTIMAKYDLCTKQNVAALQKQEFVTNTGRNQGKTKELMESVERLAKISKEKYIDFYDFKLTNNQEPSLEGDCVAQCLNCVWLGFEGYTCTCGSPMMSMDSDRIRKEKENGEAGRQQSMKKCSACRAGLPLGSGRYHYDKGDLTIPCTHNPNTGEAYDQSTGVAQTRKLKTKWSIIDVQSMPPGANLIFVGEPQLKCECGGDRANTTHSDWCPKGETK